MGLEYARQLAAEGCGLALVSNMPDELTAAAGTLGSEFGVQVATLDMDLCAPGAAAKVLEWCDAEGICPDILINNAGMFFMHYLGSDNLAKASAMVDLHVKAVTELCVLFGVRMKERGTGYILNVASMTAWIPAPGIVVYSASKAYLVSFGKGLSYELRPYGVTVTTVCPAAIDTGLYGLGERQRLWLQLKQIREEHEERPQAVRHAIRHVEDSYFASEAYQALQRRIATGQRLKEEEWEGIEEQIKKLYPGFTSQLRTLHPMSELEYQTSLLIKLRIAPTDIAAVLTRDVSTISTVRSRLYKKVFGQKGGAREWDDFILSIGA